MLITVASLVLFFHEYRIYSLFLAITQFKYFKTTHYEYNAASKKIMTFIAFNLNFRNLLKWIAFSWSKLFIFTNYTLVNIIKMPHLRGKCVGCYNSVIFYCFLHAIFLLYSWEMFYRQNDCSVHFHDVINFIQKSKQDIYTYLYFYSFSSSVFDTI